MAVNATVSTIRTTTANLTQANTSQVVRVTVPGPAGAAGADGVAGVDGVDGADGIGVGGLGDLSDVDITNPADGSLIQYNTSTTRWTDQTDISNLGTVTLNGGNF